MGPIRTINAFLPLLKTSAKSHLAKVIVISSGIADPDLVLASGFGGSSAYSVTKAAVNVAVTKYAVRFREENITFISMSPGIVNTATEPRKLYMPYRTV